MKIKMSINLVLFILNQENDKHCSIHLFFKHYSLEKFINILIMKLILWAGGINGEGSFGVALNLIKTLVDEYSKFDFNIVISSKSTLEEKLNNINLLDNSKILRLPRIYRLYPAQISLKLY